MRCGNSGGGWEFSVAVPTARKGALFEAKAKKLDPSAYEKHAASNKGDAARGRALFADLKGVACVKCHKVKGEGGEVGPELFGVAAKFNRAPLNHCAPGIREPWRNAVSYGVTACTPQNCQTAAQNSAGDSMLQS